MTNHLQTECASGWWTKGIPLSSGQSDDEQPVPFKMYSLSGGYHTSLEIELAEA